MKKWIWILALCLLLSGCRMTILPEPTEEVVFETFGTRPVETNSQEMLRYKEGMEALRNQDYATAKAIFESLGNFEDAALFASRFFSMENALLSSTISTGEDGKTTEYIYDENGRVLKELTIHLNGGMSTVIYNYNGNVVQRLTARDNLVTAYNDAELTQPNRMDKTVFAQSSQDSDKLISCVYTYDADGRLVADSGQEQRRRGNRYDTDFTYKGTYTYNEAGLLAAYERIFSWGRTGNYWETYTYDEAGNLILWESTDLSATEKNVVTEVYTYDENGNRTSLERTILVTHPTSGFERSRQEDRIDYTWENGLLVREERMENGVLTLVEHTYGEYLCYGVQELVPGKNGG